MSSLSNAYPAVGLEVGTKNARFTVVFQLQMRLKQVMNKGKTTYSQGLNDGK